MARSRTPVAGNAVELCDVVLARPLEVDRLRRIVAGEGAPAHH